MAQNLVVNGVTYRNVEALEMTTENGEKVLYTEGGSDGGGEVVILECLNPEVSVDEDNTITITGTPSISFFDVGTSINEGIFVTLKVTLEGDGTLYLPYATTGEDYTIIFAMADGQGGTAIGEFVRHDDGTETITITIKPADGGSEEPDYRDLYQRVEYITSDGEAYILTDFIADNACGAEMVVSFPHFADHTWMGSREDSGNTRFFAPYAYSASIWYAGFNGNVKISVSTRVETIYRCQANFLNSRLTTIHDEAGTLKGSTAISGTLTAQTNPICIFTQNYEGVPRTPRVFNLYSARCSRGHEIVREYIPCYRKSDGVVGLLEKFSGVFVENAGDGAFTAGPDVDW